MIYIPKTAFTLDRVPSVRQTNEITKYIKLSKFHPVTQQDEIFFRCSSMVFHLCHIF